MIPSFCAIAIACLACVLSCLLPMSWSRRFWKLCIPILKRLIPICCQARTFSAVKSPGFASRVISSIVVVSVDEKIACSSFCKLSIGNRLGVPPPMYIVRIVFLSLSANHCFLRFSHSLMTAFMYACCLSNCVVEKKSQYLQRLLQKGICIYIPDIECKGTKKIAYTQKKQYSD